MTQPSKVDFKNKYQAKGAQQVSLQEYLTSQEKTKSKLRMPSYLKFILAAPAVLLCCFGIIFIPYMIFQAINADAGNDKGVHPQISTKSSSHTSR